MSWGMDNAPNNTDACVLGGHALCLWTLFHKDTLSKEQLNTGWMEKILLMADLPNMMKLNTAVLTFLIYAFHT